MAKKKVFVDIQLQGTETIDGLKHSLKQINEELKYVDINSDSFDALKKQYTDVAAKLKSVQQELKPITGREQITAIKRMGSALSGAFQIGGAAAALFGKGTSEEFDKIAKVVGSVMVAINGFNRLLELGNQKNIAALKSLGNRWKITGTEAKIAGISMRTALISTGIGALLVGIGLLIANWEKLNDLTGNKKLEKDIKKKEEELSVFKEIYNTNMKGIELQREINRLKGIENQENELAKQELKERVKLATSEYGLLMDKIKQQQQEEERLQKKLEVYKETLRMQKVEATNDATYLKALKEIEDVKQNILKLENEASIYSKEAEILLLKMGNLNKDMVDNYDDMIAALERQLVITKEQEFSAEKVYKLERQLLGLQVKQLRNKKDITAEDERKAKMLEAEMVALDMREQKRKEELLDAIALHDIHAKYVGYSGTEVETMKSLNKAIDVEIKSYEDLINKTGNQLKLYEQINDLKSKGVNFDKEGKEILDNQIKTITDKFPEIENITKPVEVTLLNEQFDLNNKIIDLKLEQLDIDNQINNFQKNNIKEQRKAAQDRYYNEIVPKLLELDMAIVEEKNLEKKNALLKKRNKTYEEGRDISKQDEVYQNEIQVLYYEELSIQSQINSLKEEKNGLEVDYLISLTNINTELEEQSRLYYQIQSFVEKYNEEISVSQDILFESINLVANLYARQSELRRRDLEEWKEANKEALEEISQTESKLNSRRDELNKLLADAEGQRYADIMKELDSINKMEQANSAAKEAMMRKEAEMQYEIDLAEYRAGIAGKIAAIIDAGINTSLAVIKALPNVALSTLVGVLGGIQTASIAAAPTPPKPTPPKFEMGGEIRGNSHGRGGVHLEAEGGEFIVNKTAYGMYGELIRAINSSVPKFANGGEVGKSPNMPTQSIFNYNEMGNAIAMAMKKNPMFISVKEFRDVERRIVAVESKVSM